MALGTRELLLVLRARDEASRAVHSLQRSMTGLSASAKKAADAQLERGRTLTSVGLGITAVGAAGVGMFYKFTQAAAKYNQESALTLTQVDKQKISLQQIKQVGIDVAKAIPAPFEEMQKSLYDIFSSMDVDLAGAKVLLTQFSKAAVAGQVDLQDASRATIGILNAYKMKAQDVNKVNDVMFQLVRKGVGTYGEFANTIGRSVPSAVRAGQTIQDLSGMLAFLTRNGLSAAMATASAGRALDAISNPKTANNLAGLGKYLEQVVGDKRAKQLKDMGVNFDSLNISVTNASGKFKPISQIVTEMGKAFQKVGLTTPQIAETLQELFKGAGGTIQARRFFDTAVKGYANLNQLTKSMYDSSGETQKAYDIMFKQPQSQIQLLKNQWDILKVQLGDALLPVLNKIVHAFTGLFKWFNSLSPTTRKWISYIGLLISVLTVIVGVIITVGGAILMMAAAWATLDIALLPLIAVILVIIAVIALLAFGVYEVIKHWKGISGFFVSLWNAVYGAFATAFSAIWNFLKSAWNVISSIFMTAFNIISTVVKIGMALIMLPFILTFNIIKGIITVFWNWAGGFITAALKWIWGLIKPELDIWLKGFRYAWDAIKTVVSFAWKYIKGQFNTYVRVLKIIWSGLWNGLKNTAQGFWGAIKSGFNSFWGALKSGFHAGVSAVTAIWNTIKKPMAGPVNFIIDWVWNKGIAHAWNTAADLVGLGKKYHANDHLQLIKAATGGHIRGPGGERGDKIPALLSDNEYVVNAKQTRKYLPLLHAINSGADLPGFKNGGFLGSIGHFIGNVKNWVTSHGFSYLGGKLKGLVSGLESKLGAGSWGQLLAKIPPAMIERLIMPGLKKLDALGGGGQAMVNLARSQVGYHEGAGNSNRYSKEIGRPAEEWCADFIDWLAQQTGNRSVIPWTASAPGMANAFGGRYRSGTSGVMPGDIVFFGPSKAGIYHVGLASGLAKGSAIPTIAGNSSNMVRAYTGTGIAGYAHPAYVGQGYVGGGGSLIHASAGAAQAWARQSLKNYGWGQGQFPPLLSLWNRESGWRWNALNHSSGAYGIPQSLPASKMGSAGSDWRDNAATQIKWGLGYISTRYGSPGSAWAHSQRTGWYDNGGYLQPGLTLAYNGTGRPERVLGPRETDSHGGVNQTFYITTQEIDPRKHAADLGWEIARRVV